MEFYRLSAFVHFSPWPVQVSFCVFGMVSSLVVCVKTGIAWCLFLCLFCFLFCVSAWNTDMSWESSTGEYSFQVMDNFKLSFLLLVFSEIMFFLSFLWTFFHLSLSPSIFNGSIWPPVGVEAISPLGLPLLNTLLLVSSGVTVTWGHHLLISGSVEEGIYALISTIVLGISFMVNQMVEFKEASFSISDSVLGSIFLTLTGFHGFHVFLGLFLLLVMSSRLFLMCYSSSIHVSLELSIWYWHLVDCIWLLVYSLVYWWGG